MTRYLPVETLGPEHVGKEAVVTYWTDGLPQPPFYGTVTDQGTNADGTPYYAITASAPHIARMSDVSGGQVGVFNNRTLTTIYVQED